jgi:uncharacterized protein
VARQSNQGFAIRVEDLGETRALVYRAAAARSTLILAHGAGAPQTHAFLVEVAGKLAERGVDVVTFDFLYMRAGRKLPDRSPVLEATWRAAIAATRAELGVARLAIGGKSMGGRIASHLAAAGDAVDALVFFGYPLHPMGKPKVRRDAHLPAIRCPMLFVQGTRDALGEAREIRLLLRRLPTASLHVVEGADHSLKSKHLDAALDAVAAFLHRSTR